MPAVLTSATELEVLGVRGWDDLVAAMPRPSPFLLHDWLTTWWRHQGDGLELAVHVAERGGRLAAALPLAETTTFPGAPVARFVGAPDSTLGDIVARDGEDAAVVHGLLEAALGRHGLLHLFSLAPDGHLAGAVDAAACAPRTRAPVLEMDDCWDDTFARKSSRRRRSLHRRRWRKLEATGRADFELARDGAALTDALEDAFAVHSLRWDGRPDVSTFGDERGRAFNRDALAALGRKGRVRILTLRLAGRPIAFTCWIALADRMFLYRQAFDPGHAELSPGILTTVEAMRTAAGEGARTVEFLRGTERYKLEYADRVDTLTEAIVSGRGLAAAVAGRSLAGRTRLRRAVEARRGTARKAVRSIVRSR